MATQDPDNLISLAAVRAASRAGASVSPEQYKGALFEWREIGARLAPEDLALAVGYLRTWPAPPQGGREADVLMFRARERA